MGRKSLREELIESGVSTLHQRGYATAGVREITAAAGAPQGSFTNHFGSKEAFAALALDRYAAGTLATMDATLRDTSRPPAERLHAYFDAITAKLDAAGWRFGCMVGNMSLEAAEHSELLRARLAEVLAAFTEAFADTVRAGQREGVWSDALPPEDIASFILSAWQGAMLQMKVERSAAPIHRFRRVLSAMLPAPRP